VQAIWIWGMKGRKTRTTARSRRGKPQSVTASTPQSKRRRVGEKAKAKNSNNLLEERIKQEESRLAKFYQDIDQFELVEEVVNESSIRKRPRNSYWGDKENVANFNTEVPKSWDNYLPPKKKEPKKGDIDLEKLVRDVVEREETKDKAERRANRRKRKKPVQDSPKQQKKRTRRGKNSKPIARELKSEDEPIKGEGVQGARVKKLEKEDEREGSDSLSDGERYYFDLNFESQDYPSDSPNSSVETSPKQKDGGEEQEISEEPQKNEKEEVGKKTDVVDLEQKIEKGNHEEGKVGKRERELESEKYERRRKELRSQTIYQIRIILKEKSLKTSGRKDVLIQRLIEYEAEQEGATGEEVQEEEDSQELVQEGSVSSQDDLEIEGTGGANKKKDLKAKSIPVSDQIDKITDEGEKEISVGSEEDQVQERTHQENQPKSSEEREIGPDNADMKESMKGHGKDTVGSKTRREQVSEKVHGKLTTCRKEKTGPETEEQDKQGKVTVRGRKRKEREKQNVEKHDEGQVNQVRGAVRDKKDSRRRIESKVDKLEMRKEIGKVLERCSRNYQRLENTRNNQVDRKGNKTTLQKETSTQGKRQKEWKDQLETIFGSTSEEDENTEDRDRGAPVIEDIQGFGGKEGRRKIGREKTNKKHKTTDEKQQESAALENYSSSLTGAGFENSDSLKEEVSEEDCVLVGASSDEGESNEEVEYGRMLQEDSCSSSQPLGSYSEGEVCDEYGRLASEEESSLSSQQEQESNEKTRNNKTYHEVSLSQLEETSSEEEREECEGFVKKRVGNKKQYSETHSPAETGAELEDQEESLGRKSRNKNKKQRKESSPLPYTFEASEAVCFGKEIEGEKLRKRRNRNRNKKQRKEPSPHPSEEEEHSSEDDVRVLEKAATFRGNRKNRNNKKRKESLEASSEGQGLGVGLRKRNTRNKKYKKETYYEEEDSDGGGVLEEEASFGKEIEGRFRRNRKNRNNKKQKESLGANSEDQRIDVGLRKRNNRNKKHKKETHSPETFSDDQDNNGQDSSKVLEKETSFGKEMERKNRKNRNNKLSTKPSSISFESSSGDDSLVSYSSPNNSPIFVHNDDDDSPSFWDDLPLSPKKGTPFGERVS